MLLELDELEEILKDLYELTVGHTELETEEVDSTELDTELEDEEVDSTELEDEVDVEKVEEILNVLNVDNEFVELGEMLKVIWDVADLEGGFDDETLEVGVTESGTATANPRFEGGTHADTGSLILLQGSAYTPN